MQSREVLLTTNATQDLRDIRHHISQRAHSQKVADDYLKKLRRHFRNLSYTAAACPHYVSTEGGSTDVRICVAERHLAFFTFDDQHVYIKRILHQRMNYEAHLDWK